MDYMICNALDELKISAESEKYINLIVEYINNQEDRINKLENYLSDANYDLENYCSNCKLKQTCIDIVEEEYKCNKSCLTYKDTKTIKDVLSHELLYGDY